MESKNSLEKVKKNKEKISRLLGKVGFVIQVEKAPEKVKKISVFVE